jgi:GntR family transcriptional repressor for pyruvate dehydrogenase complex
MPFKLARIAKKRAYEEIVDSIWNAVRDNSLAPGDRLPSEAELSRQLQVARPTLREALSVLHFLGLLESVQGGGYYVKSLSSDNIKEKVATLKGSISPYDTITARLAVEPNVAGLAAEHRTPAELEKMRAILAQVELPVDPGEYPLDIDVDFHRAIARASHNVLLYSIMQGLRPMEREPLYKVVLSAGYGTERYLNDVAHDHQLIFDAIQEGSAKKTHDAMLGHLLNVKRKVFGD